MAPVSCRPSAVDLQDDQRPSYSATEIHHGGTKNTKRGESTPAARGRTPFAVFPCLEYWTMEVLRISREKWRLRPVRFNNPGPSDPAAGRLRGYRGSRSSRFAQRDEGRHPLPAPCFWLPAQPLALVHRIP